MKFKVKNNNPRQRSGQRRVSVTGRPQRRDVSCDGNCDFTAGDPGQRRGVAEFTATLRAGQRAGRAEPRRHGSDRGRPGQRRRRQRPRGTSRVQGPARRSSRRCRRSRARSSMSTPASRSRRPRSSSRTPAPRRTPGRSAPTRTATSGSSPTPASRSGPASSRCMVEKEGIQKYTTTKQAVAGQPLTGWQLTVTPIAATASAGRQPTADPSAAHGRAPLPTEQGNAFGERRGGRPVLDPDRRRRSAGGARHRRDRAAVRQAQGRRRRRRRPPGGPRAADRPALPGAVARAAAAGAPRRTARPHGRDARPGGPGGPGGPGHDPHRPMRPVSPGPRGADQTMIARSPLADAPTQMHRWRRATTRTRPSGQPAGSLPGRLRPAAPTAGGGGYGAAAAHAGVPGRRAGLRPARPVRPAAATGSRRPVRAPAGHRHRRRQQPAYGQPYGQQPDPYQPPEQRRPARTGPRRTRARSTGSTTSSAARVYGGRFDSRPRLCATVASADRIASQLGLHLTTEVAA